jgi:type II secretory pathway predicted ATPase ExeA
MFLDYYQLNEQPFGVTPDPHFLYLSRPHREALASLFYGVEMGRGLMALVAPPGMGKTTLLFRLLEHLRRSARTAFLFQTQCDSFGLLRYLMGDLGIDTRGMDFVTMHERLNELLIQESNNGRRVVLVIDEAQNLDDSVLETARLLSDFETPSKKLLQIVFAGQPQLAEKLQRPELAQLRQRISILGRLEPFNAAEVNHYINYRLRVAGHSSNSLFNPAAFERIAAISRGIPRNINILCFNALSLGCAVGCKQINADLICAAEADLELSSLADERWREPMPVAPPMPASPNPLAVEVKVYRGAEMTTSPSRIGNEAIELTWNKSPGNTNEVKHEQERNAELLAGSVVNEASGDAHVSADRKSAPGGDLRDTIAPESLVDELANQLTVGSTKTMRRHSQGGKEWNATAGPPILSASGGGRTYSRLAVVASVFVLALFVGVFYRQGLKTAAAQTDGALSLAAARLSLQLSSGRKSELATPRATMEHWPKEMNSGLSEHSALVKQRVPASTTPRQDELRTTPNANDRHLQQLTKRTAAVIVQSHDDLRQICLRQLGSYNVEVLREIEVLNPELSDPDRIIVGQRIVLPASLTVRTNASKSSSVPRP